MPLPYATVDFEVTDPNFATHAGNDTVAGLLSGYDVSSGTRYYVFCSELNQSISLNATYSFALYSDYVDAPIQDGRPMGQGTPLNRHEKKLVAGVLQSLGVAGEIVGFVSPSAQDLIGIAITNPDSTTLKSISNDEAAAAQIAIWTLVHGLDKSRDNVKLQSDTFKITRINNETVTPEFSQLFETTVETSFSAVPEPSVVMAAAAVIVPALARRSRRSCR
jgi:hypothetical protein